MSTPDSLNSNVPVVRRFTPLTPFHDPQLDPNVPKQNLHMVPQALFAGRKPLNRLLPRPPTANLHVMPKLPNDPDELQKDFHDKIPQINDVLGLWGEVEGADPTTTGEAQLRLRAPVIEDQHWTSTDESKGTASDPVSDFVTPGQADLIYPADASEDSGECAEEDLVPSNLRATEWSDFDGSYVHLEDAKPQMDFDEHSMRRDSSTPINLRVTQWLDDEQYNASSNDVSSSQSDSDARPDSEEARPYETFWASHNHTEHR